MYTVSHDYYAILGVSKNATLEEISEQYRKLMKEHHPDQFKGMRAKYQSEGDQDLLKVIDERIREAEEMCKLLNEAFEVLSDPVKRKEYDNQVVEPTVPLPEISIHPARITFGSLLEGQEKSLVFIIENKGGPPAAVNIDWEGNKPTWGELLIEPDEGKVFPIKVTVKVDTTGIPSGPKEKKILVEVDGRIHMVDVFLAVTKKVVASARPTSPPTSTPSSFPSPTPPAPSTKPNFAGIIWIAIAVGLMMAVWGIADNANRQAQIKASEQEATAQRQLKEATEQAEVQKRQTEEAQRQEIDAELKWVAEHPDEAIEIRRIGTVLGSDLPFPQNCDGWLQAQIEKSTYGQYEITSCTRNVVLHMDADTGSCTGGTQKTGGNCVIEDNYLRPGDSATAYCVETKWVIPFLGPGQYERERYCWEFRELIPDHSQSVGGGCLAIPFP